MKKMKSSVHATMMAHLWFLRDLVKDPTNVLCGEYIMHRTVSIEKDSEGLEKEITRFYMTEPRTQFKVSCDPEAFRFGSVQSLREMFGDQKSYAFGLLGDLARVFQHLDVDNGNDMFTNMLASLIGVVVEEHKDSVIEDDEGFRDFVEACKVANDNMLNFIGLVSDNLIMTFQNNLTARQCLSTMVDSVGHPKVRAELKADLKDLIVKR